MAGIYPPRPTGTPVLKRCSTWGNPKTALFAPRRGFICGVDFVERKVSVRMDEMKENSQYSIEPKPDNMQTPSSDKAARANLVAIEMPAASRARWKAMLTARKIVNAKKLLSRVPEILGEPTARRAFNGQRLDRDTWQAIFDGLKLDRADFFTDVQWFDRNINTQWQILWDLAADASDRFGLVLNETVENSELGHEKFVKTIVSRTSVSIEIPWGLSGYLILVEQDAQGNIVLLSPSPLMAKPILTGAIQRLPQYPPSPFPCLQPITVGTNNLWAGIFAKSPDWRWLADAQKKPLRLQLAQLTDLYEYARKQPSDTQIFRSSYVVTDA